MGDARVARTNLTGSTPLGSGGFGGDRTPGYARDYSGWTLWVREMDSGRRRNDNIHNRDGCATSGQANLSETGVDSSAAHADGVLRSE